MTTDPHDSMLNGVSNANEWISERWDVVWYSSRNGKELDRETFESRPEAVEMQRRALAAGSIARVEVEPTLGGDL